MQKSHPALEEWTRTSLGHWKTSITINESRDDIEERQVSEHQCWASDSSYILSPENKAAAGAAVGSLSFCLFVKCIVFTSYCRRRPPPTPTTPITVEITIVLHLGDCFKPQK
ncbi:hypothetical protein RUM44_000494 [Polyplax serrata]|uniref:Uncharacterized protein n=1 Tax=Polyplax serrata TaxID=468196 RepID=A0ABR1B5L2_POLSC